MKNTSICKITYIIIVCLLIPVFLNFQHESNILVREEPLPNLVFVFSDQHRRHALGFMNEDPVYTPNIDRFARQGIVMKHAISNVPVCSPYRAMLLTGRFPLSTGMTGNTSPNNPGRELNPEEISIAEVLKERGYRTGYIGKWHLDDPTTREQVLNYDPDNGRGWDTYTPPGPERQGFDYWYAFNAFGDHANPHYWKNSPDMIEVNEWSPKHEVNKAIEFIEREGTDQPFALFVSHLPPHGPYVPPQKYREIYEYVDSDLLLNRPNANPGSEKARRKVKGYYAAVSGVDDQFGRLMKFLEQKGLTENTIVVFSSDHGEMMGSHGKFNKGVYYEEAIGIPFIIRWPEKLKPGVNKTVLGVPDVMPTLLGLMDVTIPDAVEGRDLSEYLLHQSQPATNTTFLAQYPFTTKEIERLLSQGIDWRKRGWRGIRTPRYTYIVDRGIDGEKEQRILFDNKRDPDQLDPEFVEGKAHSPKMRKLNRILQEWMSKMDDPFPLK